MKDKLKTEKRSVYGSDHSLRYIKKSFNLIDYLFPLLIG